jgi:hypothetical protein
LDCDSFIAGSIPVVHPLYFFYKSGNASSEPGLLTKQNKTKQNKTKQNKTKQNKTRFCLKRAALTLSDQRSLTDPWSNSYSLLLTLYYLLALCASLLCAHKTERASAKRSQNRTCVCLLSSGPTAGVAMRPALSISSSSSNNRYHYVLATKAVTN